MHGKGVLVLSQRWKKLSCQARVAGIRACSLEHDLLISQFLKKALKIDFPTNEDNTLVVDSQNAPTPNLRNFQRAKHQAVVFDDISGPMFVWQNKKLMQQHIDGAQLGHSPTGNFTYEVWLWRVPVICTANKWDVAGSSLDASDAAWIEANCIVQHITEPVWIDAPP